MLTVIAAAKGGFFAPRIKNEEHGEVRIAYIKSTKSKKALARLRRQGGEIVLSPALRGLGGHEYKCGADFSPLLPRALAAAVRLPLDELFIAAEPERAAEIISLCRDAAKLFTVLTKSEKRPEAFDELYFNKGIIIRRTALSHSRIGERAFCISDGGRGICGMEQMRMSDLGKMRLCGGALDFLEEKTGLIPTAELYFLAGLPLPDGAKIEPEIKSGIFCLDNIAKM